MRSRYYLDTGFPLVVVETEQSALTAHAHDFYEMVYIRRGRGTHVIENIPYAIRAGDFYFLRPGEAHAYLPDGSLRIVNILWQPSLVRELLRADADDSLSFLKPLLHPRSKSQNIYRRLHLSGSAAYRVENLLDEMRRETEAVRQGTSAPGGHSLLRHLFCALLVLLSRASVATGTRGEKGEPSPSANATQGSVARAIAYLEAHSSQTLRVQEIADHVALSPGRFAHVFKAQTGRSPIEYLHELRMGHVCAALSETTCTVQEIAGEAGYNDLRFFHRIFRRYAGCSPGEYRQRFATQQQLIAPPK